jgi:predicted glutamine amidotransferase
MCRLYGFRSAESMPAVRELLTARGSLAKQSTKHPDGWGIATFTGGDEPTLVKGLDPAHSSARYAAAAHAVDSATVIAHVRKASVGGIRLRNTHPFTHDGWVFAHNGTIQGFDAKRAQLERMLAPRLRRALIGDTDSERCFALFLTLQAKQRRGNALSRGAAALLGVVRWVAETEEPGAPKRSTLNVLCSNGEALFALRFNKELCYAPTRERLEVASQSIGTHHRWRGLRNGTVLAIDQRMQLRRFTIGAA